MRLKELLGPLPPPLEVAEARSRIAQRLRSARQVLVVLDDDPTGTQTVHGVPVYTQWTPQMLRDAVLETERVFYISTNTRALARDQAIELNRNIGAQLHEAARMTGRRLLVASRSDSTLRGHYPHEVEALAAGLTTNFDGQIIVPAFFDGGRYTVGDVHYVDDGRRVIPAAETEFARDPTFGFKNSDLRRWIEEKTDGRIRPADVTSIPLEILRGEGPAGVTRLLEGVEQGRPVIVNAACEADLEVFVLGLIEAESAGKRFLYRCAASFVKIRAGVPERPLLTHDEILRGSRPGLILIGSYVERTTQQLEPLLKRNGVEGIELAVDSLIDGELRAGEIAGATARAQNALRDGRTPVLYTSRQVLRTEGTDFLRAGAIIIDGLCRIVRNLRRRPAFVIAKGGITSIEVARKGLDCVRADVLGQAAKGVPVWRMGGESRWPGIPLVVFPGNVGGPRTLVEVFEKLIGEPETKA